MVRKLNKKKSAPRRRAGGFCATLLLAAMLFLLLPSWIAASPDLATHTVTFQMNDQTGALHLSYTVLDGSPVPAPPSPTRAGYQFRDWSTDVPGNRQANFNDPVTADQTLWAQWQPEREDFLVLIFEEDGTLTELKNVEGGEEISVLEPLIREGYRFTYWSQNHVGGPPFNFARPIIEDVELYPNWRAFPPPTGALDAALARHGNRVSVYFENLETGFVYQHNADRVFTAASVVKAPFSLYIYEKAERGETDLDSTRGGRPQRELLRRNLMYSCNDGTHALRNIHGIAGYRQFVEDLGGNPGWVASQVLGSRMTVEEAGLFARAIFEYIESDGRYSEEFKAHLLDNQFPFITGLDYPVASKTGWVPPVAWHDMAIVYAPSPFILVIFSSRSGWSNADFREYAEIAQVFQRFNNMWFVD